MILGKKYAAYFTATATFLAAAALVPSSAMAQDDTIVSNILAAPVAIVEAPFIAADNLLFGSPAYYAPGPVYAYAGPISEVAPVGEPNWISYCSANYHSFDPSTGTYLGYDGSRHYCR